jgi:hypothetical protein
MAIKNNIKSLKRAWVQTIAQQSKVSDRAHALLVKFGHHYVEHGDTSLLGWAVETTWNTGFKREAMISWVKKHLKVTINEVGGGRVVCEVTNKNRGIIDMAIAAGDLFYLNVDKAEKKETPFDLPKSAKSIVTRAIKAEVSKADVLAAVSAAYDAAVKPVDVDHTPVTEGLSAVA